MLKCPHCGALNDDDSRFCVQCGTRLPPAVAPGSSPAPEGLPGAGAVTAPASSHAEPARKPQRRSLMQTLGLAPAPSPPPAPEPPPVVAAPQPSAIPQTQTGMGAAAPNHRPLRPAAPEVLAPPLGPHQTQLADALTDAADRVASAPGAPGSLAAALSATAPKARASTAGSDAPPGASPAPVTGSKAPRAPLPAAAAVAPGPGAATAAPSKAPDSARPAAAAARPPAPAPGAPPVAGKATVPGAASGAPAPLPFGDLLDDIDDGFDRIVRQPGAPAASASVEDYGEVRALFAEIAATHMGPVRDFMIELRLGEPPREWLDLVLPAVRSLRTSAAAMGLGDLVTQLEAYVAALEVAMTLDEPRVGGEARDRLTTSYAGLIAVMPSAFGLDEERDRREPIIVQSLLKQVPEVRKVALDKLYAAGLTSLSMYYVAKPYDIAEATGLSREVSARIIERFARYRDEIADLTPDATRSREHAHLAELTRRLAELNEDFEAASRDRPHRAADEKRRLRSARNETVLQIDVLLARLGEVALVERLERLPFHGKVAALDGYLAEVRTKQQPPGGAPAGAR